MEDPKSSATANEELLERARKQVRDSQNQIRALQQKNRQQARSGNEHARGTFPQQTTFSDGLQVVDAELTGKGCVAEYVANIESQNVAFQGEIKALKREVLEVRGREKSLSEQLESTMRQFEAAQSALKQAQEKARKGANNAKGIENVETATRNMEDAGTERSGSADC